MILIILSLLGGIVNRIRGGLFEWFPLRRTLSSLLFGLAVALFTSNWLGLLGALGMLVGQSLGWGRYLGALGGWERKDLTEVSFIDRLTYKLRPKQIKIGREDEFIYSTKRQLRVWGFTGLSLRGFVWSLAIWVSLLPLMSLNGLLGAFVGLFMPVAYLIPLFWIKPVKDGEGNFNGLFWEHGEVVWGITLWFTVFLCL